MTRLFLFILYFPSHYVSAFSVSQHENLRRTCSLPSAISKPSSPLLSKLLKRKTTTQIYGSSITSGNNVFTEEELIRIAKDYTSNPTSDMLSDDFIFRGPVIGPLCKQDFVETLTSVGSVDKAGLSDAFPDLEANMFGFSVDPIEPGRVWYFTRPRGTFLGPFDHPVKGRIEPTGAPYIAPPEARSIIIDANGKIKYQSVGYVTDRFTDDTTGGRGAVFGMYAVMGEELDDTIGSPFMVFLQWLSTLLPNIPKSFSKKEDLPTWWKDPLMGAQK